MPLAADGSIASAHWYLSAMQAGRRRDSVLLVAAPLNRQRRPSLDGSLGPAELVASAHNHHAHMGRSASTGHQRPSGLGTSSSSTSVLYGGSSSSFSQRVGDTSFPFVAYSTLSGGGGAALGGYGGAPGSGGPNSPVATHPGSMLPLIAAGRRGMCESVHTRWHVFAS